MRAGSLAAALSVDEVTPTGVCAPSKGDGSQGSCCQCSKQSHIAWSRPQRKAGGAKQHLPSAGGKCGKVRRTAARATKAAKMNTSATIVAVMATPMLSAGVATHLMMCQRHGIERHTRVIQFSHAAKSERALS